MDLLLNINQSCLTIKLIKIMVHTCYRLQLHKFHLVYMNLKNTASGNKTRVNAYNYNFHILNLNIK